MTQQRYGPIAGHKFVAWIETGVGLVAVDTGWDVADGQSYEGSDVEALVQASEATGQPLTHVLLTHDHPDHVLNLPLLRERWPDVQVLAHPNNQTEGVTGRLRGGETLAWGELRVEVLHTPGHAQHGDELCFFLPQLSFLFCGDVAQPQGPSYALANGPSPVPFFYDGDRYRRSLERLIALDPHRVRTGHGDWLGPEQARQWFRVTLATVARIEALALALVEQYPQQSDAWLAETIYDTIADERHFGRRAANQRKRQGTYPGITDYERFDLPGILWAVRAARSVG